MTSNRELDLGAFRTAPENKIFSGRPRGEEVRRKANVDSLEKLDDVCIAVKIPEDTFTLNLSFFLGLFAQTVAEKGKTWFERHYSFTGPKVQLDKLPYYVEQAEKDAIPLPKAR